MLKHNVERQRNIVEPADMYVCIPRAHAQTQNFRAPADYAHGVLYKNRCFWPTWIENWINEIKWREISIRPQRKDWTLEMLWMCLWGFTKNEWLPLEAMFVWLYWLCCFCGWLSKAQHSNQITAQTCLQRVYNVRMFCILQVIFERWIVEDSADCHHTYRSCMVSHTVTPAVQANKLKCWKSGQ